MLAAVHNGWYFVTESYSMADPKDTAAFLLEHRRSQEPMDNLPDALYPNSKASAFLAQDEMVRCLTEQYGSAPCGYKIACTNERIIHHLNVSGPFPGQLMTHSTYSSGIGLDPDTFRCRIMEAEFGFVLGEDVPVSDAPYDAQTIRPYIEAFVPSLEIVDHRFHDFATVGECALIADNAIHSACIVGEPVTHWQPLDFIHWPVRMWVNGDPFPLGTGESVLGNPLNAMAWLANHLASRKLSLCAGERVCTGTVGEPYHAVPGDAVLADFGDLGQVSMQFHQQG